MNAPPRPQPSAQKAVSCEQIRALIETPDAFIAWLRRYPPDAEVASIDSDGEPPDSSQIPLQACIEEG